MKLVICSAPNHFKMVKKNLHYYFDYLPIDKIVVIGDKSGREIFRGDKRITVIDEEKLYPGLTKARVRELVVAGGGHFTRSNWYFQQFLKMAYAYVCKDEMYLIWDADTIPLRKIELFDENGKPQFSYCDDYSPYYYDTIEKIFDGRMRKAHEKCFIVEHMVIYAEYMKEMLADIMRNEKLAGDTFFAKILSAVDRKAMAIAGFSEFETYATYMLTMHEEAYGIRKLNAFRNGIIFMGYDMTEEKRKWLAKTMDTVSFEHFYRPSIFRKKWLKRKVYKEKTVNEIVEWYSASRYSSVDKAVCKMVRKIERIKYLFKRFPGKLKEVFASKFRMP